MNGLTGFEPERGRENICFRARPRGGRFGEPRGSPDGGRGASVRGGRNGKTVGDQFFLVVLRHRKMKYSCGVSQKFLSGRSRKGDNIIDVWKPCQVYSRYFYRSSSVSWSFSSVFSFRYLPLC